MLIINDTHLGFTRVGGTTAASREALRTHLFNQFEALLEDCTDEHLLIAGDLLDGFEVSTRDLLQTWQALQGFLNRGNALTLVAGNHDWAPRAEKVSSFELLCKILQGERFKFLGINSWAPVDEGVFALAHCDSQVSFDTRLEEVLLMCQAGSHLILHANYANGFAAQSDHSLNVSETQAQAFKDKGVTLLFAHEHQARKALAGTVQCLGNQWPTSVADCLGNDAKYLHRLDDGKLTRYETWRADGGDGLRRIDWRELEGCDHMLGFVRVTGTASAAEASAVIDAISQFRATAHAFVVTNGVKTEGAVEVQDLPEMFSAASKFDILAFIKDHLEPKEVQAVDKLLENLK